MNMAVPSSAQDPITQSVLEKYKKSAKKLQGLLEQHPRKLRKFSRDLRRSIVSNATSKSEYAGEIKIICNNVKTFGIAFLKLVHPFNDGVARCLFDMCNKFILSPNISQEDVEEVLDRIQVYQQLANMALKMNVKISSLMKSNEDQSHILLEHVKRSKQKHTTHRNYQYSGVAVSASAAVGTAAAVTVGSLSAPFLLAVLPFAGLTYLTYGEGSNSEECRVAHEADEKIVQNLACDSLPSFIDAIDRINAFFSETRNTLQALSHCSPEVIREHMRDILKGIFDCCENVISLPSEIASDLMSFRCNEEWLQEMELDFDAYHSDTTRLLEAGPTVLNRLNFN